MPLGEGGVTGYVPAQRKKKTPLAGTQGRGGAQLSSPRVVKKHIYRGVSFYSAQGNQLGPQQLATIRKAAEKIPSVVWDRLARQQTKVIIMKNKEGGLHPLMRQYLSAIGIPRRSQSSLAGEKDISFTDNQRHPVAIVGIGSLPLTPSGERRPVPSDQEGVGHILLHETAHTLDESFAIMKALGSVYGKLERRTFASVAKARRLSLDLRSEPMSVVAPGRTTVSNTPEWKAAMPKHYTAGYGEPSLEYDKTTTYPRNEVFAEALAKYWDQRELPGSVKGFFDDYFSRTLQPGGL